MDGARRRRPHATPREIAAASGVLLAGVVLIAGIVLVDPRWHRILGVWPDGIARVPSASGSAASAIRPEEQRAATDASDATPRAEPETGRAPVPVKPARAELTPAATRSPSPPPSDTTQVMASLLVSQLGLDLAWRTAAANAEGHAADTPEHIYWRGVAAAIRDGQRPRP